MDWEELEPRKKAAKPRDLQGFSIEELKEYIANLEGEIRRAQAAIEAKTKHRSGADAFFRK